MLVLLVLLHAGAVGGIFLCELLLCMDLVVYFYVNCCRDFK